MGSSWRLLIPIYALIFVIGCATGKPSRWGQFRGDPANRGFQQIESGFALSSRWISNPYRITSSSPVIGKDFQEKDIIYVGTIEAILVAIRSEDGVEKWKRSLGAADSGNRIISSPCVSDKGDIFVITSRKDGDGQFQSILHKVNQFGLLKWSYPIPENGFTTGSPKVITTPAGTLIFAYLTVGTFEDIQSELFVLRDDGNRAQLIARQALASCRYSASDNGQSLDDAFDFIDNTWNLVSRFPVDMNTNSVFPPDNFLDPTIALVTDREKLLIAIADNLCSIGAFEWDGNELSILWQQEHSFGKHSSAAISANGLMVFGRGDGKVLAYDVVTGIKMWEYEADQAVFATPGIPPKKFIFVVSKDHLQVINALDGTLIHDDKTPRKISLLGATHTSPAVTANRVYLSTFEMLTVTYDLKTRGHDTTFRGNGLASIAIGRDGAVYGVAADGTIRKYGGTE
jgi:outer membrane protein assembly factor BamB